MSGSGPVQDGQERWRRVKVLFAKAIEKPSREAEQFLQSACGGDEGLRREVESLLYAHRAGDSFIEPPAVATLSREALKGNAEALIGQRIGAYEITSVIGAGGMGVVYLARRADQQFEAVVAVKLIRREALSEEMIARFLQERQTLADLNHPMIARLYDGGVTADGLPYQILEYVRGQPIDLHCDHAELSIAGRLMLFESVCRAVHFAHQRLVIHCDLKPSNILVTDDGAVKLLDFGLARALKPGLEAEPHVKAMTPAYASPEQVQGGALTTVSDIYSLGVILYELLTGRRPYPITSLRLPDVKRVICEQQPNPPSVVFSARSRLTEPLSPTSEAPLDEVARRRGASGAKLKRSLRGDLDAIVLKAMQKDPQGRYASAEQLADDVRNYLALQPVIARPASVPQHMMKWGRRNRLTAIASLAAAVSLVGGILATSWWAGVAVRQRDVALRARSHAELETEGARVEAHKLRQVTRFYEQLLFSMNQANADGKQYLAQMLSDVAGDLPAEFVRDPEVDSAIRQAIAENLIVLGRADLAEAQLRKALEIQLQIHGQTIHPDVARHHRRLGEFLLERGRVVKARAEFQAALHINRALYGQDSLQVAQDLELLARAGADAEGHGAGQKNTDVHGD